VVSARSKPTKNITVDDTKIIRVINNGAAVMLVIATVSNVMFISRVIMLNIVFMSSLFG